MQAISALIFLAVVAPVSYLVSYLFWRYGMKVLIFLIASTILTACAALEYNPYENLYPSLVPTTVPASLMPATVSPSSAIPLSSTPLLLDCTVTAAEALNLRRGPGTNHAVIHVLKSGEPLTRTNTLPSGNWWEVTSPSGQTGWINSNYCK